MMPKARIGSTNPLEEKRADLEESFTLSDFKGQ